MASGQWTTNRVEKLPKNWKKIRTRIIRRDQSVCQLCFVFTANPEVDHIDDRNDHRYSNLRVLCTVCHAQRTAQQGVRANRARAQRRYRAPERHPGEA